MSVVVPVFQQVIDLADQRAQRLSTNAPITTEEIYPWIKQIRDPEHPTMTLQDLKVVCFDDTTVCDADNYCRVTFTPTTP